MKVFADTSWFQAILSTRDEHHEAAIAASAKQRKSRTNKSDSMESGAESKKPGVATFHSLNFYRHAAEVSIKIR